MCYNSLSTDYEFEIQQQNDFWVRIEQDLNPDILFCFHFNSSFHSSLTIYHVVILFYQIVNKILFEKLLPKLYSTNNYVIKQWFSKYGSRINSSCITWETIKNAPSFRSDLMNQSLSKWALTICALARPPVGSDAHVSLNSRIVILNIRCVSLSPVQLFKLQHILYICICIILICTKV